MMFFNRFTIFEGKNTKTLSSNCPPPTAIRLLREFKMPDLKNKKGFTLAETLITLTIIGVIAALTVPTLISKYQKQQFYAGAVKAQNTFQTWLQNELIRENCPAGDLECAPEIGVVPNPYLHTQKIFNFCTFWQGGFQLSNNKDFLKRFGVVQIVSHDDLTNKYKYKRYKILNGRKVEDTLGHTVPQWFSQFITKDGMMWAVESYGGFLVNNDVYFIALIRVDTNGLKGPNISGLDIAYFFILPMDIDEYKKGVVYPLETTLYNLPECTKSNVTAACTAKMLQEKQITYY